MKKLLKLAATALLATSAAAAAKTYTVTFNDNECTATIDVFADRPDGVTKPVLAGIHENDGCGNLSGIGFIGNVAVQKGVTEEAAIMASYSTIPPWTVTPCWSRSHTRSLQAGIGRSVRPRTTHPSASSFMAPTPSPAPECIFRRSAARVPKGPRFFSLGRVLFGLLKHEHRESQVGDT